MAQKPIPPFGRQGLRIAKEIMDHNVRRLKIGEARHKAFDIAWRVVVADARVEHLHVSAVGFEHRLKTLRDGLFFRNAPAERDGTA